jgi:hypothetical protein
MTTALQTFYPKIAADVPWEVRQHLQLIYQKLNNHAQAIVSLPTGNTTTNITEVNQSTSGGGGGGGSTLLGLGGVNNQTGVTAYTTQNSDGGILIILNDASAIAVTLNVGVSVPWMAFISNQGAGTATLTPQSGTITYPGNPGAASMPLLSGYTAMVAFDATNFWAWAEPMTPLNTPAISHEWLNSYNSTTGAFTQTQPAFTDISGIAQVAQGGTGTATPSLVAGTNVTITGSWPDQTINASGGGGATPVFSRAIFTAAQRPLGSVFQNTSAFPLIVMYVDSGTLAAAKGFTDASATPTTQVWGLQSFSGSGFQPAAFVVMPGNFYKITGATFGAWSEFTFNTGTWTSSGNLSGSRTLGTAAQNTGTGFMLVQVFTTNTTATNSLAVFVDSASTPVVQTFQQQTIITTGNSVLFLVPPSYFYKVTNTGTGTIASWIEYSSAIACTVSANLFTAPATRSTTVSSATPPIAYSVLNNSNKCKWVAVGITNTAAGTIITQGDTNVPPLLAQWEMSQAVSGTQPVSGIGLHLPNEFLAARHDTGTNTNTFWYEYALG